MYKSNNWTRGFLPLWLALLLIINAKVGAQTQIRKSVVSAAGGISQSTSFKALMTVGQSTPPGLSQSASFKVSAGFLGGGSSLVTVTFNPTADAYVNSNQTTTNFGTATTLRMKQSSPTLNSYLKFVVSGVNGVVQSAKLRLKVTVASNSGGSVFSVSNNFTGTSNPWTETGLNFNNAPGISGSPLSTAGSVTVGQTVELDVTPAITGNGTFSFGLNNASTTTVQYSSKEGANPPELVIEVGPPPPPPTITSFTPTIGAVGTSVIITGTNLSTTSLVRFNGVTASFSGVTNTKVTAIVPTGATTGPISVTTPGGTGASTTNFTVLSPPNLVADAYVKSDVPTTNFGTATTLRVRQASIILRSYLKFTVSGLSGVVQSAKLRLKVTVASNDGGSVFLVSNNFLGTSTPWTESGINYNNAPAISGTPLSSAGSVTVGQTVELDVTPAITSNGTFSFGLNNASTTTVQYSSKEGATPPELVIQVGPPPPPPTITSFAPPSGPVGASVTITGTNLSTTSQVKFNGVTASFSGVTNTQVTAIVPTGATAGKISVTTLGGTATSADDFTVIPLIVLNPMDDAYVKSDVPTTNFGTATTLRARQSAIILRSYLKFVVSGVTGSVQSARLRLQVTTASNDGGSVFLVSNFQAGTSTPWTEGNLNYNNAPIISGSPLSSAGSVTVGQTVELDVTPAITGNGTFSLGLQSASTTAVQYSSKEGATKPELVIQTGTSLLTRNADLTPNRIGAEAEEIATPLPEHIALSPNYPNPFNAQTVIEYALPEAARVRLVVYNLVGQMVRKLVDETQPAGYKRILWDGRNEYGGEMSSGIYFLQLMIDRQKLLRKMLFQR